MIDWIQAHLIHLGIGTLTLILVPLGKKYLPVLAKKYADVFLSAAVNPDISDPADKEDVTIIIKASMRIAARRMASASGQAKMNWVVDYVCSKTRLKREDVIVMAQGIYDAIKEELKEHGAIAIPADTGTPQAPSSPADSPK